jgi:hypothetical protein
MDSLGGNQEILFGIKGEEIYEIRHEAGEQRLNKRK